MVKKILTNISPPWPIFASLSVFQSSCVSFCFFGVKFNIIFSLGQIYYTYLLNILKWLVFWSISNDIKHVRSIVIKTFFTPSLPPQNFFFKKNKKIKEIINITSSSSFLWYVIEVHILSICSPHSMPSFSMYFNI